MQLCRLMVLVTSLAVLVSCARAGTPPAREIPVLISDISCTDPGGRYLLVSGTPGESVGSSYMPKRLWMYDPNTRALESLSYDYLPEMGRARVSPSGYLAFYAEDELYTWFVDPDIWFTADFGTTPPVRLGNLPPAEWWTWHPDEDILLVGSNRDDGSFSITAYDPVTQEATEPNWFEGRGELSSFALSPNGAHLALAVDRGVRVVDLDNGSVHAVDDTPEGEVVGSWSPDGNKLLYMRYLEEGGGSEMYVTDPTGQCQLAVFAGGWRRTGGCWQGPLSLWVFELRSLHLLDLASVLGESISVDGVLQCPQSQPR